MKARMWIVGVLVVGLAVLLAVVVQALEAQPGVLGPQPPTPGSVRPSSGCFRVGTTVYFTTTWSDLDGYADLKWCYFLIGTSSAPSNSIYLGYNRAGNKLYLRSNNGTAWWGGYAPCSANVIQNAQGKLDCSKTKVTKQGNTVRVRWAIIFKSTYIGNKNLYLRATDMSGNNSGWKKKGTVTIQSAPCPTPTATPTATEPATGLPWGMFQHEPQHTGRSPFISAQSPNLLWIFFTPGTPGSPAIGNDGTIYLPVGMLDEDTVGYLYAINPDGTEKWHVQLGGPPSSTAPAIGPDGTIYVHCNGEASTVSIERLHAITPGGVITWTFEFNGGLGIFTSRVQSSPAVASDGTIYVGSMDTNLYALNPDGTVKWARSPNLCSTSSSPAVAPDGTIYFVNSSTRLYAYAPDGTFKWSYLLADSPVGTGNDQSPTVGPDGTVYVGSPADHRLYAIWPDGTLRWRFLTGWGIRSTPSIGADGTVYVGSDGLYALNPDGTQKWKFGNPLFSSASPVIGADGTIYWRVGWDLYAVDAHGIQKWKLDDYGFVGVVRLDSTPALTSDWTLYVPTCQGLSAYWAPPNAPAVTPTLRPSCPDPYEPNNGFASAWPLTPGSYQSYICCRISWPGIDYDYFKFYANVGDRIEVRLTNLPDNYDLHLYAPDQTLVGFSMNSGKSNEFIGHTAQQTGHYYVKVWGSGCECSPSSPYTLQIALNPPTPTPTSTPSS